MSRIAKKKLIIPDGIKVEILDDGNKIKILNVKSNTFHLFPTQKVNGVKISVSENNLSFIFSASSSKFAGLLYSLIQNSFIGLVQGYTAALTVSGLGYKVSIDNGFLTLNVGFSHPVKYTIPSDVSVNVTKDNEILISGTEKQRVFQVAAEIKNIKKPDAYHAKGIYDKGAQIICKQGKKK